MTTIWAVEHGEYEDYSVDALYDNEDAARSHCEQMNLHAHHEYSYSGWEVGSKAPELHWVWIRSPFNTEPLAVFTREEPIDPPQVYEIADGGISVTGTDRDAVEALYEEKSP
jgi:hypothetical protein